MGGGGGMGTLQALLTELSGLKKPRGIFNRYVRRALGMRPKPPPNYRILVIMATNLPDVLDPAHAASGPHRPHLRGRLSVDRGPAADVPGLPRQDHAQPDRRPGATSSRSSVLVATGASIKDIVNEALVVAHP